MSRWTLFRQKSFMLFWFGIFLSFTGDVVLFFTVSWTIVQITGSGVIMGTFMMLMGVPRLVLIMFGGVVVDRSDPRKLMMYFDLLRSLLVGMLLVILTLQFPPLWVLFLLAILLGTIDAFYWPACGALRQRLVSKEFYAQASSLYTGTMQITNITGPVLAAGIVGFVGTWGGIAWTAGCFALSSLALFMLRAFPSSTPASKTETSLSIKSFARDLGEGLGYVRRTPVILAMIIVSFFANAGANTVSVGLPFLAQSFGVGVQGLGNMSIGWGIGGVLGALLLSLLVIHHPTPRMTLTAFLLQGVAIFLISFATLQWQVTALLIGCGICSSAIQALSSSVNQTIIPPELMGRVMGVISFVSMGSTPFCQTIAGILIDTASVQTVYWIGGLLEVSASALAFLLPTIRMYGKSYNGPRCSDDPKTKKC